ncbi:hypothetical protein C9426_34680 [Serratia sp. S1B]|nr:hypothetical protein C9426_34680 [Serratia sp. S1B]
MSFKIKYRYFSGVFFLISLNGFAGDVWTQHEGYLQCGKNWFQMRAECKSNIQDPDVKNCKKYSAVAMPDNTYPDNKKNIKNEPWINEIMSCINDSPIINHPKGVNENDTFTMTWSPYWVGIFSNDDEEGEINSNEDDPNQKYYDSQLKLVLCDFRFYPVENAKLKLTFDGKIHEYITNKKGAIKKLMIEDATQGLKVELQNPDEKQYTQISEFKMLPLGNSIFRISSSSTIIKFKEFSEKKVRIDSLCNS